MNQDDFDALIRDADPMRESSCDEDSLLVHSSDQWQQLSRHRVVVRKRLAVGFALASAVLLMGGAWVWMADRSGQLNDQLARSDVGLPAIDSDLAVAPSDRPSPVTQPTDSDELTSEESSAVAMESVAPEDPAEDARHLADVSPKTRSDNRLRKKQRIANPEVLLAEFEEFVRLAGKPGDQTWTSRVLHLSNLGARDQAAAIDLVSEIKNDTLRDRAFQLVCDAAGPTRDVILRRWLADSVIRPLAWERLVTESNLRDASELVELAANHGERELLCRRIAQSPDPFSLELILSFVGDPDWRIAVRETAPFLNPYHIDRLVRLMRQRDLGVRTSAAFVLASIPGPYVDQVVCEMITGGRYRQPAYLVLLSRNTPLARAFLAQAASRPDLTPALVSARVHFANIQPTLSQWINESQGVNDDPSDTTKHYGPTQSRGQLHAGLVRLLDGVG